MSINSRFGTDKKHKSLGKFWNSIDFEYAEINLAEYIEDYRGVVIGYFIIGNSRFPVTYSELNRMIETCHEAQDGLMKKINMGLIR